MRYLSSIIAAALVACATFAAASDGSAGRVKTVNGSASIVRGQSSLPAVVNERVFQGDTLRTGPDGSLGVILKDDTSLSLGPNSVVVVDQFLFAPAEGKLSLVTRMLKGTAVYISGIIAKLSPQSVRFETPNATIGIRGTRFLVKVDED
ncbi:MAG: FecR domain-containing protein [Candidatus Methylomirabilales bacterium]